MTDSRRKGRRFENEVVGYLRAHGYNAERISEAGLPGPDIQAFGGRFIEAKIRERIPQLIRNALRDAQVFVFREDRGPMLVCMELDELLDMLDEQATKPLPSGGDYPPL